MDKVDDVQGDTAGYLRFGYFLLLLLLLFPLSLLAFPSPKQRRRCDR